MKTIVIGLGNPILGDDGVGWCIAEQLKDQIDPEMKVDVDCLSLGGMGLMEHLIGYERAILIDAFISEQEPGSITISRLSDLPNFSAFHITRAHDTSLQNAIQLGKSLGAKLPDDVTVVGISANYAYDFSEELSQPVLNSVQKATKIVINML